VSCYSRANIGWFLNDNPPENALPVGLELILPLLWVPGRRALLVEDESHPIFISFSDGLRELCQLCVSNTQPVELARSHVGFRARRLNHCAIPADTIILIETVIYYI